MNTIVLMRGMRPAASCWLLTNVSLWKLLSKLMVLFWGEGVGGQGVVWETMVRVRLDRNISMLDVYRRALRPALSIRLAATATDRRRTAPTMAASYLRDAK